MAERHPTVIWLALHTEKPGLMRRHELRAAGYRRIGVPAGLWSHGDDGLMRNIQDVAWPAAEEDWGHVRYVSFWRRGSWRPFYVNEISDSGYGVLVMKNNALCFQRGQLSFAPAH